MRGLGSDVSPLNVAHTAFDEVHWVAPHEAVWACRTLAATHYTTGGWSVGAVSLVAGWYARTLTERTRIVAIFPDGPTRYYTSVFDNAYCAAHHLLDRPPADDPQLIHSPGQTEVRGWTRMPMRSPGYPSGRAR